ncbi:MAG: hypothetical protein SNJ78_01190 [Spirochaetales bacterium]
MKAKLSKFFLLLKLELEEIQQDLQSLLEIYRSYEQKHQITNYVLQENSSLIQAEIAALGSLKKLLDTCVHPEDFESLDDLVKEILAQFKEFITKKNYPLALYYLIERKVQKVVRYINIE